MTVDQLISELLLREDKRGEIKVLLMDGATVGIKDLVDSKDPSTVDDFYKDPPPGLHSVTLIRLEE